MGHASTGRVYAVIGATGGIGSALSRRLAAQGARLALGGRDASRTASLSEEVGGIGVTVDALRLDDVEHFVDATKTTFGRFDGIVNCAGSFFLKPAHSTSEAEWEATISTNLTTAFTTVHAAARSLDEGGSIVLLSSAAARVGFANHEAIAAAKAGVIGLTLSAAATYAPRGVRVNAVAPGLVRTPATERLTDGPGGDVSRAMHPLGRLGKPEDVASAVCWLLQPEQSWVTGQVIGADGGIATLRAR